MPAEDPAYQAPELGEVGSWTVLEDGAVGQVWAPVGCRYGVLDGKCRHKGCPPAVWVVDGHEFHLVERTRLTEPGHADQPDLF